jgi:hypothetical protein
MNPVSIRRDVPSRASPSESFRVEEWHFDRSKIAVEKSLCNIRPTRH